MAIKQALIIGKGEHVFKCSLLNEAYLSTAWSSTTYNPVNGEFSTQAQLNAKFTSIGDSLRYKIGFTPENYMASLGRYILRFKMVYVDSKRTNITMYIADTVTGGDVSLGETTSSTFMSSLDYISPVAILYDDDIEEATPVVGYFYKISGSTLTGRLHSWIESSASKKIFYTYIRDYITEISTDPWRNSGYADIGGGECELDLSSDVISLPDLPVSATSTGFIQLYTPSYRQINELSDYMWGDGFVNNVLKLWNDPMDIIINLAQFPINIPHSGTQLVTAGNVVTTVEMDYPPNQFIELDCGSLEVKHFYNAYLDYEPYTSCKIFLPYVGTETISMDDIMGKTINVKYRIDLISGACVAFILCDNILLYTFTGACSVNIPVSGQTFAGLANAVISTVTAGAVAKGAGVTSKGNPIPSSKPGAVASSLASNVMACKPVVERSGSISANMGLLGAQKPYLIFTVPRTCLPKDQNVYLGYPTFMTFRLSEISGYTEIEEIRLDNVPCTEEERDEIKLLLKEGVIL